METDKIKAILAAVKYKTLSRAASEFSYTPSALSHMADSLEDELGVKLLVRTHKGVSLTEDGELLKQRLENVLVAENELKSAVSDLMSDKQLSLRIGTYSSISNNILPGILKSFKRENPDIQVFITVTDSVKGWLEKDLADVIFGERGFIEEDEYEIIMKDRYVAVLQKGMLPGCRSVNIEELYSFPYISTNQKLLDQYIDQSKFSEILYCNSSDDTSIVSMVKEGVGIAVLPSLSLKNAIQGIKVVNITPGIYRYIVFAHRRKNPAAVRFVEFMKNYIKQKIERR